MFRIIQNKETRKKVDFAIKYLLSFIQRDQLVVIGHRLRAASMTPLSIATCPSNQVPLPVNTGCYLCIQWI